MSHVNKEYTNSEGTRVIVLGQNASMVQVFYHQTNKRAQRMDMDLSVFENKVKSGQLTYVRTGMFVSRSSIK